MWHRVYSYFGSFGDPLDDSAANPYPDGLLARLSDVGVNGVWMHVVLRQLAPGDPHFPEFGDGHERRLANLRRLVEQTKKYGIGIYLYMNEPRAMPPAFFEERPEMAGKRVVVVAASTTERYLSTPLAESVREEVANLPVSEV